MVMLSVASCCTAHAADVIEWRLENPFRFFNRAEDTQKHLDAFKAIYKKDGNTKTPILEIERQLSRDTDGRGWAEAMYTRVHQEPCWITSKDKCEHPDYVLPKTHAVKFRLLAQSGTCIWSVDKGPGASIPVSA